MRLRIRFTKLGKIRFLSHRDLARLLERTARRAGLRLAYSEGFSPRPKLSFGLALSTGYESLGEYLDLDLVEPLDPGELAALPGRLSAILPEGLDVTALREASRSEPSLQQAVTSCSWLIELAGTGHAEASEAVSRALGAPTLLLARERKGTLVTDDLRPAILALSVVEDGNGGAARIEAELGTQPRTLRPSELLAALDPPLPEGLVRRTHQWITRDGARWEVLPAGATGAEHARERAS